MSLKENFLIKEKHYYRPYVATEGFRKRSRWSDFHFKFTLWQCVKVGMKRSKTSDRSWVRKQSSSWVIMRVLTKDIALGWRRHETCQVSSLWLISCYVRIYHTRAYGKGYEIGFIREEDNFQAGSISQERVRISRS